MAKKSRAARKKEKALQIKTVPKKTSHTVVHASSLTEAPDLKVNASIIMAERMDCIPEVEPPVVAVEIAPDKHQFPLYRGSAEVVQVELW